MMKIYRNPYVFFYRGMDIEIDLLEFSIILFSWISHVRRSSASISRDPYRYQGF